MRESGFAYVPSQANFILIKTGNGEGIFEALQDEGIIARSLGGSLEDYLRITIGTPEQNSLAIAKLAEVMKAEAN